MRKSLLALLSLVMVFGLFLSACGSPATEAPATQAPAVTDVPAATDAPATEAPVTTARTRVRWFVGLGAGSDEGTFAGQQAVVDEFNASQNAIELVLEIVDNDSAYDVLATQIAAGNAPDIVGPVGIRGRDSFKGAWLDLQPLIDSTNYDLSDYDPAMVEFYQVKEEGQLGIPFAIYPSFVIYNLDLFDEAGLAYPPAEHGAPYIDAEGNSRPWDMDTLRELGMLLTVDANGNDATSPDFDPENIVQFGWQNQWTDPRGIGTFFGAGSIVADDGKTVQIPAAWEAAWEWTYNGWWQDHFIPNGPYGGADFLQSGGGTFGSGNLAMVHIHMWYVAPWALDVPFEWQLAATPSYNGVITAKMHADTFGIPRGSKNHAAAFEVLSYLLSSETAGKLLNVYGGMPARLSMQDNYFDTYSMDNFPTRDINWDVVMDAVEYPDNPNHESWMPAFQETTDRYNEFWNYLANTPDLDFQAEIGTLKTALQRIFDAAQ